MIKTLIKWVFFLVVLAVVVVGVVLPMLANTESGRKQVADALGDALHREVSLGGLDIGWFFSSVDIKQLEIMNPEGFPPGPFLRAGELSLDVKYGKLKDRQVVGGLKGTGLELHIIRKNGRTNLEGIGGKKETSEPAPPKDEEPKPDEKPAPKEEGGKKGPDLDLSLELLDATVTIDDLDKGEKLVVEGVSVEMRLSNQAGVSDAGMKIRVREIDQNGLKITELEIDAKQSGDWLDLEKLRANLPGQGRLKGDGRLQVKGGDAWNVKLSAESVGLNEDVMPVASALFPMAAQAKGQATGRLDANFEMKGNGLTWEAMKPTLSGIGSVKLSGLGLPSDSLLAQVAKFAGRAESTIQLNDAGAQFDVKDGWMMFNRLSASGDKVRYDFAGRVSLDGKLDLTMDLMPLVKAFGGDKNYAKVKDKVKEIPMRIGGTTANPDYKPPKVEDLLKGAIGNIIEKEAGGLLDKIR